MVPALELGGQSPSQPQAPADQSALVHARGGELAASAGLRGEDVQDDEYPFQSDEVHDGGQALEERLPLPAPRAQRPDEKPLVRGPDPLADMVEERL